MTAPSIRPDRREAVYDAVWLPSYDQVKENKRTYAKSFYTQYQNTDPFSGKRLLRAVYGPSSMWSRIRRQSPFPLWKWTTCTPFPICGRYHPSYEALGGVPAISEVKFSLISNRGCFGGCSFCALTFHQGRIIQARSHESIVEEAKLLTEEPDFKGYIHDVGGPTADFRFPACEKQMTKGACPDKQCLFPKPCKNLVADHRDYHRASYESCGPFPR